MPAADTVQQVFEPLRLRYADSPVPGWLRSAGAAVSSLLPVRVRRWLGTQPRQLVLQGQGTRIVLGLYSEERMTRLGDLPVDDPDLLAQLQSRLAGDATPRWLWLQSDQVLRRPITLPMAAETRLRDVLAHEIDRQTPFAADQASFETRVLARDPVGKQIKVELVVLPKARLEARCDPLGPLAEGLSGVDVMLEDGRPMGVNLLPLGKRSRRQDRARRIDTLLAMATVLALLLSLWLILDNRQGALEALRARVDADIAEVRGVRRLRNELQSAASAANFLRAKREGQPTVLEVLNDLTRRIPDDTSLDKLSINDGRLTLLGASAQAPALVGLLQQSPLLKSPALAGAVQADPVTHKDRFTLTATLAGAHQETADVPADNRP